MPVIKSAKKKLRQDKKETIERAKFEASVKEAVRKAVSTKTAKVMSEAVSLLDKAAKKHIFHKNKVARIKSRLAHLLNPKGVDAASAKQVPSRGKAVKAEKPKTAVKKTPVKKSAAKKSK